jgi:hypothetical protein
MHRILYFIGNSAPTVASHPSAVHVEGLLEAVDAEEQSESSEVPLSPPTYESKDV